MAIYNIFSKRQRQLNNRTPEILSCEFLSNELRVQIVYILEDVFGRAQFGNDKEVFQICATIKETLCREYGIFYLGIVASEHPLLQIENFILKSHETEKVIDAIELSFQFINKFGPDNYYPLKSSPNNAINELNDRFKEHGVGFSFLGGEIIKVDSTYQHAEITKPVVFLLWNKKFEGACEEYLKAHEHYRHGRNKECLSECLKAFESTIKIICKEKKWGFKPTDNASKLIEICFVNNLMPKFSESQFTAFRSLLESGIPTLRNKLGGHGQGQILIKVENRMAKYGLNLTGSNIIILVEQSELQ